MSHIVSREPWGVLDIDQHAGRVLFRQDWHYKWILFTPNLPAWTHAQKAQFHNAVDRQIWGVWSNRIRLQVAGAADFAKKFGRSGVGLNFDIRWVTAHGQWEVTVRKMPPGSSRTTYRSNVTFDTRRIELDSADLSDDGAENDAGASTDHFRSPPHEFGHTLQLDDEYNSGDANLADTQSVMNIGRNVRARHLKLIVDALNKMIPGVKFSAPAGIA